MNYSTLITLIIISAILNLSESSNDGFSSSSTKFIKINEKQHDKKVLIFKNVEISSARAYTKKKNRHNALKGNESRRKPQIYVFEKSENVRYEEQSCIAQSLQPLREHADFAQKMLSHRVFVPIGSSFFYNKVSMLLTGRLFDRNDHAKACIRVILSKHYRRYLGFGKREVIPCEGDILDATCTCTMTGKPIKIHSTAVWSDGAKVVLMVACNSGKGGWAVASNQRTLDEATKKIIRAKIAEYSFDQNDVFELSYDECDMAIKTSVQEGGCDDDIVTVSAEDRKKVLHVLEQGVYTPFSSPANVYALGMLLKGVPLEGNGDEKDMCARHHWSLQGSLTSRGFNHRKTILECDMADITNIQCLPEDDKGDNNAVYVYNKNLRPIWTDGSKYVLTYNCLSTHLKTWALYSTTEDVDEETKEFVLNKISEYGFDPKLASLNSYSECSSLVIPTNEQEDE